MKDRLLFRLGRLEQWYAGRPWVAYGAGLLFVLLACLNLENGRWVAGWLWLAGAVVCALRRPDDA